MFWCIININKYFNINNIKIDFSNQMQFVSFMKNIALAGGFLFLVINGYKIVVLKIIMMDHNDQKLEVSKIKKTSRSGQQQQ